MIVRLCLTALLLACATLADAQPTYYGDDLTGHWLGAYVRDGSVQVIRVEFAERDDTLRARFEIPDWAYYGMMERGAVMQEDDGTYVFPLAYGTARVQLDSIYQELVGTVGGPGDYEPPLRLHLKRTLRPPEVRLREEPITAQRDGLTLSGTLVAPITPGPHPTVLYVHGRGCPATRDWALLRMRELARRGYAGAVFDKRGSGASEGDCTRATVDDLSGDMVAALAALAEHPEVDAARLGLMGLSAGGWVAPHAAARSEVPVAFLITLVGPATSVKEQQADNMRLIARELGLSPDETAEALSYVDWMFADGDPETLYREMQALVPVAEAKGWDDFFAPGDVPETPEAVPQMWVRRHSYDPGPDLKALGVPTLAIYGGADRIVPPETNVPLLRQLMAEAGNDRHRVVVLPEAGHSLEHGSRLRQFGEGGYAPYYFKFDRVAAGAMQEIVDFLDAYVGR